VDVVYENQVDIVSPKSCVADKKVLRIKMKELFLVRLAKLRVPSFFFAECISKLKATLLNFILLQILLSFNFSSPID